LKLAEFRTVTCEAVYTEQKFYTVTGLWCCHHADI